MDSDVLEAEPLGAQLEDITYKYFLSPANYQENWFVSFWDPFLKSRAHYEIEILVKNLFFQTILNKLNLNRYYPQRDLILFGFGRNVLSQVGLLNPLSLLVLLNIDNSITQNGIP